MRTSFALIALALFVVAPPPATAQLQSSLVAEIVPGPAGADLIYGFTVYDDRLFFVAGTPEFGRELWAYDAATDETSLVADINPGPESAFVLTTFAVLDGRLYFIANDGTTGRELFVYDAATDEVALVDDTTPGPNGFTVQVVAYDDRIFFTGAFLLWAYDPATDSATRVVAPDDFPEFGVIGNLKVFGDRLLFSIFGDSVGAEPAYYDAVPDTYDLIVDLNPGPANSQPLGFVPYDGRLFFSALTPDTGRELFVYDPVTDAATLAADVFPGPTGSAPSPREAFDGRLFFSALSDPASGEGGTDLWAYDAATETAALVVDVAPDNETATVAVFGSFDDTLILVADPPGTGDELYAYDPATETLTLAGGEIVPGPAGASINGSAVYGGRLFFSADDGVSGQALWALSATATSVEAGLADATFRLGTPYPNPAASAVTVPLAVDAPQVVRADVFDALGRHVATLHDGPVKGAVPLRLDASVLRPGVYVVRATADGVHATHRLTVVR